MRQAIVVVLAALAAVSWSLAGPAPDGEGGSPAPGDLLAGTAAAPTELFLGEVEFRHGGDPLGVRAYQLVGKTAFHPFAPDTAVPSRLTDAVKPPASVRRTGGPWVGFAGTVRHITVEFDLGDVVRIDAFELQYLCAAAGIFSPHRVRFFPSLDGRFPGQGWGTDSDADLPVPHAAYNSADFSSAAAGDELARQVLLTLPRPANARFVRLVFSFDIIPNLVLSDSLRSDLSDVCTASYSGWPVIGSPGEIQGPGGSAAGFNVGSTGSEGFSSGSSGSPPTGDPPDPPAPTKTIDTTTVPEPATAALLVIGGLGLVRKRARGPHPDGRG